MKRVFKFIVMIAFTCVLIGLAETKVEAATSSSEVFHDNENGILTVKYNNKDHIKMKISVTKDKKSYYYNLNDGENEIDVPLSMGNGCYTVKILKNIVDNRYSVVMKTSIDLKLEDDKVVFTQSNVIVDFKLTDKSIEKADSLTKNCKTEEEVIDTIYQFVVENFVYDYENVKQKAATIGYIPDIEIIYQNKTGICYDISAIMAAMMRSQGITVKLVTGYTKNIDGYHAWNSIYDSSQGSWLAVDGTYDIGMIRLKNKYSMVKKASDYVEVKYEY